MARLAWLTDLHLNFVEIENRKAFYEALLNATPDAVLISGDIAEAPTLPSYLRELVEILQVPIHFVLGNHDFYYGSVTEVRETVCGLVEQHSDLTYLSNLSDPIELAPELGLVGHDGWADGRIGDYETSMVMMNDYRLIREFVGRDKQSRWEQLMSLADEAADHFRQTLPLALNAYQHTIVLTHVPPWREACWYQGQTSNDEWAPHFASRAVGDAIAAVARQFPQREITVLCGHTHSPGEAMITENLRVWTGGAVYGQPEVCRLIEC